jgi:pilus assembly protein CpaB
MSGTGPQPRPGTFLSSDYLVFSVGMNPRQRRGLLLLVLAGLGLLAVFVLVASYVADVRTEVDPKIKLLALSKPVKAYESVPDDAVTTITMPKRWAPRTALRDRSKLVGKVAGTDLSKDSLLQDDMLVFPPDLAPGQREVAILVDAETGVAGKIGPNSTVDIVATYEGNEQAGIAPKSTVVVPAARIIEVGQPKLKGGRGVQEEDADPKQVVPVTFALTPLQQLKVTEAESFAQEVRLARRRPNETTPLKKNEQTYTRPELR